MILGRKTLFSAITLLSIMGYGFIVFAVAPPGGYVPGQTTDPNCAPGDTNCSVQTAVIIGSSVVSGMQNQLLYTDADGNVFGDSLFTRDSTTGDTNILALFTGDLAGGYSIDTATQNANFGVRDLVTEERGLFQGFINGGNMGVQMSYEKPATNVAGGLLLRESGNTLTWDFDTTDSILDGLIQGNNLNGVGLKGNALAHYNTSTYESAAFFAGDTTANGGNPYEASMTYVLPGGINGVFGYIVNDDGLKAEYYDILGNIKSQTLQEATGNTISWDADTTDDIQDAIVQNTNLLGLSIPGSMMKREDINTTEIAYVTTASIGSDIAVQMRYADAFPLPTKTSDVTVRSDGVFLFNDQSGINQRAALKLDINKNELTWDADTTDNITTSLEQSQDILGLGALSGSALTWQDTSTQVTGLLGAIDGTGVGLFPGSILMSTNNIATGASSSITTNYDNVLNIATAIANVGNGDFDSGFEFDDNRMVVRYRNNTSGLESSFESDATSAVTRYTSDGTNEYQTQLGDGTFAFLNTTTNDNYLSLNGVAGSYGIGDLNGAGSSTRLSIDDVAKTITGTSVISGTKNTSMQVGTIAGLGLPGSAFDYSNSSNGQSSSVGVGDFTGIGGNPNSGYVTWYDGATFAQALLTTNSNGITGLFTDGTGATYSNEFKLGSAGFTLSSNAGSYTFPLGDGSSNYLMATDGSGQLFWQDPTMVPSDRSLKSNISGLSYGLDTLMQLNPVSYTMNSTGKDQIGFIAQEVESLVPELVGEVANGKKGLAYGQMTAVIVKSVQDLNVKLVNIENFASAENKTFLNSLIAWLADTANGIGDLFASRINTHELCVDGQCLNQNDVRALLELVGQTNSENGGSGGGPSTPVPSPEPIPSDEPIPDTEPTDVPSGEVFDPVVIPEPTPEPGQPPEPVVTEDPVTIE